MKTSIAVLPLVFASLVGTGCGVGGVTFSPGTGSTLTIDAIVSSETSCSASEGSDFYFGRFGVLDTAGLLYSGVVRFQLCKSSESDAFFKDFTLEHFSAVGQAINENIPQVTSRTDLEVNESLDTSSGSAATNFFQIIDADLQYGYFEVDFGNTNAFGELITVAGASGGVVFTSDLSTMAGGDNESFIFIAQKIDSLEDVTEGDVEGSWDTFNFTVGGGGTVSTHSTSTVTIGDLTDNLAEFSGDNSDAGAFGGTIGLNDATSGGLVYQYTGTSGTTVDGALIASPDNQFALGFDFNGGFYFAAY